MGSWLPRDSGSRPETERADVVVGRLRRADSQAVERSRSRADREKGGAGARAVRRRWSVPVAANSQPVSARPPPRAPRTVPVRGRTDIPRPRRPWASAVAMPGCAASRGGSSRSIPAPARASLRGSCRVAASRRTTRTARRRGGDPASEGVASGLRVVPSTPTRTPKTHRSTGVPRAREAQAIWERGSNRMPAMRCRPSISSRCRSRVWISSRPCLRNWVKRRLIVSWVSPR